MKKYVVSYFFDGNGEVEIEAENENEARDKFFNGEYKNEQEWGDNYSIADAKEKGEK